LRCMHGFSTPLKLVSRVGATFAAIVLLGATSINGVDVAAVLAQRATLDPGIGIATGTVDHGVVSFASRGPVNEHSVFELASITKTFTATLLAQMVLAHEVALDDPIDAYMPAGLPGPVHNGKHITLLDLATHSSGLPDEFDFNIDPWIDFAYVWGASTNTMLFTAVSQYSLTRDPGTAYDYSNAGVALLGQLLARRAGTTYEALIHERILMPLHMDETDFDLTPLMRAHLAAPHNRFSEPVKAWTFGAMAPAAGLHSTAADMVKYVRLNLGDGPPALVAAARFAQAVQPGQPIDKTEEIGLVWNTLRAQHVTYHNGVTAGTRTWVGVNAARTQGVVVLTNRADNITDIALHLLDPASPVKPAEKPEYAIDQTRLQTYAGTYVLSPTENMVISRNGPMLFIQRNGRIRHRAFATAPGEFDVRESDSRVSFTVNAAGAVTALVFNPGNHTYVRAIP
jgi:D-alanyl-D-alanine-carboxypeptidase/D-alanyl-D-alanine-endopeptidase